LFIVGSEEDRSQMSIFSAIDLTLVLHTTTVRLTTVIRALSRFRIESFMLPLRPEKRRHGKDEIWPVDRN